MRNLEYFLIAWRQSNGFVTLIYAPGLDPLIILLPSEPSWIGGMDKDALKTVFSR